MTTGKERKPPSPYAAIRGSMDEENPVDVAVDERLPQDELRARIDDQTRAVLGRLGHDRNLMMDLEALYNEFYTHREEAYFNIGYEYGIAAGRADAIRRLTDTAPLQTRAFTEGLRHLTIQSELPGAAIVAALIETAWVFAIGLPDIKPEPEDAPVEDPQGGTNQ